ncbi:MAG: hypothetical protein II832_05970 [Synergistaceae bacterium]|nr:hypothetical protein [Synergistaceae bacterium]
MKKFLKAIFISVVVSTSAFGATSNDIQDGIYLRQDVFEARMNAFMTEIRLMNEHSLAEVRQEIQSVREKLHREIQANSSAIQDTNDRIDVTNARLDDLYTMIYWALAFMGIVLAVAPVVPYVFKMLKETLKPFVTLEDIAPHRR